uniref:Uncharacterized protein n=1 Tax=Rhizophora mucronata TaxID=61149 RepID=A0A2P2N734_RHIMU
MYPESAKALARISCLRASHKSSQTFGGILKVTLIITSNDYSDNNIKTSIIRRAFVPLLGAFCITL